MTTRRIFCALALGSARALFNHPPQTVLAADVGQPAPDFKPASTTGRDISLSDYRGKKWVLLEFYGADFAPT